MSITNDTSPAIVSSERTLAASKKIAFFKAGDTYALRRRKNGNPCGPFGTCLYMRAHAVTCKPWLVQLTASVDSAFTAPQIFGCYNNSSGNISLGESCDCDAEEPAPFRAAGNCLTCIIANSALITMTNRLLKLNLDLMPGTPTSPGCCLETSFYATRLAQCCLPCEEDVYDTPCCGCSCDAA